MNKYGGRVDKQENGWQRAGNERRPKLKGWVDKLWGWVSKAGGYMVKNSKMVG